MRFAKWVFLIAGVYGVLLIAPSYFLERRFGEEYPPAINHPEFFYGFMGAGLAWQFMYLLIGSDPPRYRTAMLIASAAKTSFAFAVLALYWQDRVPGRRLDWSCPTRCSQSSFSLLGRVRRKRGRERPVERWTTGGDVFECGLPELLRHDYVGHWQTSEQEARMTRLRPACFAISRA